MCLTVSNRHPRRLGVEFPKPFVCDKDILVFKSLNVATYTVEYKGACNSTLNWSSYPSHHYVTPAFAKVVKFENSRAKLETDKFGEEWSSDTGYAKINEGIHTAETYGGAKQYGGSMVFFSVIPAGEEFYIGTQNDVVSKKIIIFETEDEFMKYREERGKENLITISEFKNIKL